MAPITPSKLVRAQTAQNLIEGNLAEDAYLLDYLPKHVVHPCSDTAPGYAPYKILFGTVNAVAVYAYMLATAYNIEISFYETARGGRRHRVRVEDVSVDGELCDELKPLKDFTSVAIASVLQVRSVEIPDVPQPVYPHEVSRPLGHILLCREDIQALLEHHSVHKLRLEKRWANDISACSS